MKIDVWYDVVCPWCWLGKARLDKALAGSKDVEVFTHSFELDTKASKELDVSTTDWVMKRYGLPRAKVDAMHEQIAAMGREAGIEYRFDRVRTANTFDAHQLVHHARAVAGNQVANDIVDRLFRANFHDGLRVGNRDVLLGIARDAALDETDAAAALDEQRYAEAVRADEDEARSIGVSGVPFFLFAGKIAVSGAQPLEVLERALAIR